MLYTAACRQPAITDATLPAVKNNGLEIATEIKEYPLMPMELFEAQGRIQLRRAPIHTFDSKYRSATYTYAGEITVAEVETYLFPTDILVIYLEDMDAPQVFLARSPNSGCILQYIEEANVFGDPCYGSTFELDGTYIAGPAQQDLDQLPSEVKGEMLWVRNEIVYGTVKEVGRKP